MNELYLKYLNESSIFNEKLVTEYKEIFSDKISNNLINLLNLQINLDNRKYFI